jgi:hypothetical protein
VVIFSDGGSIPPASTKESFFAEKKFVYYLQLVFPKTADINCRKGEIVLMNHGISSAIGELIETQGPSLTASEAIAKLKGMFSDAELEEFYQQLKFPDLEQAVQAIISDIKG